MGAQGGDNVRNGSIDEMGADIRIVGETIVKTGIPGLAITYYNERIDEDGSMSLEVRAINRRSGSEFEFRYAKRRAGKDDVWELTACRGEHR